MKRRGLFLGSFPNFPEHLTRSGKVEAAFRLELMHSGQQIVSTIAVGIHRRKAILKAFRYKALGSQVIALVDLAAAQDMEQTRIAF